jgi:delta 1-pyrroline-5-carboxylate dehydrogenase
MGATAASLRRYEMLIDGEFVTSSRMLSVINPATEEVISEVPACTIEDVNRAVLAAEEAQKNWAALPAIRRAGYLREIATLVRANREVLARVITEEQGKILSLAQVEVDFSADYLDYMAEFARRYEGEIIPSDRPGETILLYKAPIGVIAGILPWKLSVLPDRAQNGSGAGHRQHHRHQAEQRNPQQCLRVCPFGGPVDAAQRRLQSHLRLRIGCG